MAQYIYTMNRVSKMVPPKREILKDISLSFFPGAKIGVLGLNGAGKSTLLRIMAGVDKDFSGEARAQPGIKIGYLEQEPPLDESKDVRGNVEDGLREPLDALARLDEVFAEYAAEDADFDALAKEQEKLEAIIQTWDAHNLTNQMDQAAAALNLPAWDADVSKLSGGERRRVALCRLLLSKPDMLLLDEPTNGVDPVSRRDFWKILHEMVKEGVTVFVSTSYLDEAERCERVGMMQEGRLTMCDNPRNLKKTVSESILEIMSDDPGKTLQALKKRYGKMSSDIVSGMIRFRMPENSSPEKIEDEMKDMGVPPMSINEARPTLEDVFVSQAMKADAQ